MRFDKERLHKVMLLVGGSPRETTHNLFQLRRELSQAADAASTVGDISRAVRLRNGALRIERAAKLVSHVPLSETTVPLDVREDVIEDIDAGLDAVEEYHRPGIYLQR